ncbi:LOW QUALITY PROTEIN: pyridoxal phosphate-dependent transferase [Colletotrichum cereale]|nr:LOW QUALITY PROTEIN: pyridoxal phosphate-dependent transferase [Colletotrichum cereale]
MVFLPAPCILPLNQIEKETAQKSKRRNRGRKFQVADVFWRHTGHWFDSKNILLWFGQIHRHLLVKAEARDLQVPEENDSSELLASQVTRRLEMYRQRYIDANSASAASYVKASESLAGGNTRSEPFSMPLVSGQSCQVTSKDGREYLDLVVQATMAHGISLRGTSREEQALAKLLSRPALRFCNSGTEANTMALTTALYHTGRKKILALEMGYHGGVVSFNKDVLPTTLPSNFVLARYGDAGHASELVDESFAAIIVEPMQSVGGMIPASILSYRHYPTGAVLIFDEVVTSRLHCNALQSLHDVYPDMTTIGKFSRSGTFNNNNAFSMAAGATPCRLITPEMIDAANALSERLRAGINAAGSVAAPHKPALGATGFGSLLNVHIAGPEAGRLLDCFFFFYMRGRGIYVSRRGLSALNITHTHVHISRVLDAVRYFV